MSNALRRKKKLMFYTKSEMKTIKQNSIEDRNTERVVMKSYKDYMAIGCMILHDMFGFGQKRLIRFENTINQYSEVAVSDENMRGSALSFVLKEKYGIDLIAIVNKVPQSQLMKLYVRKGKCVGHVAYKISSASMFNYFALTLTALKTMFKFSKTQLKQFTDKFVDYIDTLTRYEQFQLTIPMIVETLADETNYLCDYCSY